MSKTQLFLRQESADLATAGDDAEKSLEIQQAVAENVEQVESASGAVTEVETGIDNALEAEGEVAAAVDTMEEAEEEGGMTPREAELVEARLERACRLLGADMSALGLTMRRESFGAAGSRLATTKMKREAAEGLGKRIWEAVKKAWQWLKDFATNLFAKLVKSSTGVRDRAKDLQGRLAKLPAGVKTKKDNMSVGASFFSVDGKSGLNEIRTVGASAAAIEGLFLGSAELVTPEELSKSINAGEIPKDGGTAGLEALRSAIGTIGAGGTIKELPNTSTTHGKLPGQKTIRVDENKQTFGDKEYTFAKVAIVGTDGDAAKEYKALSVAELKEVAKLAVELGENLVKIDKARALVNKMIDTNIKYCNDFMKIQEASAASREDEAARKAAKDFLAYVRAYMGQNQSMAKLFANALPVMQFDTAVKACDVVAAGISNLKEEEKK